MTQYQNLLTGLLARHAKLLELADDDEVQSYRLFDKQHARYMLCRTGWLAKKRIQTPYFYVHIKDEKLWIYEDYTEDGLATDLLESGISCDDIVLDFHHPSMCPYTEFADFGIRGSWLTRYDSSVLPSIRASMSCQEAV